MFFVFYIIFIIRSCTKIIKKFLVDLNTTKFIVACNQCEKLRKEVSIFRPASAGFFYSVDPHFRTI